MTVSGLDADEHDAKKGGRHIRVLVLRAAKGKGNTSIADWAVTLSRAVTPSQSKETVLSAFTTWRPDQSTIGFPAGMMDVAEVLNTAPERSATARPYCCIFGCVVSFSGGQVPSRRVRLEKKVRITSSSNLPGWFAPRALFSRALAVQALVAGRSWQPKPAFERTEGQPGLAACFWVTVTVTALFSHHDRLRRILPRTNPRPAILLPFSCAPDAPLTLGSGLHACNALHRCVSKQFFWRSTLAIAIVAPGPHHGEFLLRSTVLTVCCADAPTRLVSTRIDR